MKARHKILAALALAGMLMGCGNARPASSAPLPSDESSRLTYASEMPSVPSESSEEPIPSSSESHSEEPAPSSASESSSEEPVEITYTAAEAVDAVAEIISGIFGADVSAAHDDDGDYLVLNFGSAPADTIKAYCDYFIPEGFEPIGDWESDQFGDGTPVDYLDCVCGDVGLEFLVYEIDDEAMPGYGGTYLQVVAFDLSE